MEHELEKFFYCPYCGSQISVLIETYSGGQEYIEDCEVCCRPIQIEFKVEGGTLTFFNSERLDS